VKMKSCSILKKYVCQMDVVSAVVLAVVMGACSTSPKLTPEDRAGDIEYLAQWAKDNSPFVELNEKYKDCPSYEALLPKYVEFAKQAKSNEEFYMVASNYYNLICATGHAYLISESELKWVKTAIILGILDLDINPFQTDQSVYWARLARDISTRAHPPFHILYKEDKYFTDDEWQADGVTVPRGSEILKVDGMDCSSYLDFIKENTLLRYCALPKDFVKQYLLIIDEGPDFAGWQVVFRLPNGSIHDAFVPKIKGLPRQKTIGTEVPEENCKCIELSDDVGYIWIKGFMSGPLDYLFPSFAKKDRKKIRTFLDKSNGKYNKLIIDIRNNIGGLPQYGYDNLICPFLEKSVTYNQIAGIRRKYADSLTKSVLRTLRRKCSTKKEHVVSVKEVDAPDGFDRDEWVFYQIDRRIEPRNRYNFNGSIYVLVNGGTFSAADDYANTVKRIGFAKLVGQNTRGGCAAYIGPPILRLPQSGMIFRVETELVINPDGSFNELFGTPPDIKLDPADLPKSISKEELLKDEWIKQVIIDD